MNRTVLFTLAVVAAGCGGGRTSPAMNPKAPAAFDPAGSDPQAIVVVDKAVAALGGEPAWASAKQLRWKETIWLDGKAVVQVEHAWDRWNGRHRMSKNHDNGNTTIAMYELYGESGTGLIVQGGVESRMGADDARKVIDDARKRWGEDSWYVAMPFRLKDPGVSLDLEPERTPEGGAVPKWDVVKVTFAEGTAPRAGDVYYVVIDKATGIIDSFEVERTEGRIGYRIEEWRDAGGLKLPGKLQNIGYEAERIELTDVSVDGSPDDELYVPAVGFD